ncbi:glycosyltransferase family 4 protein [Methanoculleus horonobensis]|uniref:glycosyltransferase family 4 protein n=1 Tax=Methanoculleus horonobensis TaxID=528314 RepID=UPI000832D2A2|nr:glycosyltransferase family 4 protein [Methanoculleus horonobensis]
MGRETDANLTGQGRILILAGVYVPVVGGYIKIIRELAQKLTDSGYIVDILTCNGGNAAPYETLDGVNVYRLSSWDLVQGNFPVPKISYRNTVSLLNLAKNDYHCIITNTRFYPICFIGWLLSRWHAIPLIHLEHGSQHTVSNNSWISLIANLYDHSVGSLLVRKAAINFGVSTAATDFLRHLGAKKAKTMHNGIDISSFQDAEPDTEIKRPGSIVITYIGRLIYAKGVQDLLSVFPGIQGDVQLLIVGDGSYRSELEALAHRGHISNITFFGELRPENVPGILKSTDIFVNPSYSEGLPTSVLEACAAGCAVIATDVGGTEEIIHDGSTGFLIKPGDRQELTEKIGLLLSDKVIRETVGKNAQAYVMENFSWDLIMGWWITEMRHLERDVVYTEIDPQE